MEKYFKNGMVVVQFLEFNFGVEKVIYFGLFFYLQYELVKCQCIGCIGMIIFYIKGIFQYVEIFFKNLKLFILVESLGGFESFVEFLVIMIYVLVFKNDRDVFGISDILI